MTSHTTWMTDPKVQDLAFSALKIPGTHDSGSYSLTHTLSQIKYGDIAFLWKLSPGSAPTDGTLPWAGGTYYLGPQLHEFVMGVVDAVARSQGQDVLRQLNGGIRYFDLRVYYDTTASDFYVQHGLRGCTLSSILGQVKQFLQANPSSQELIILELSHTNFNSAGSLTAADLTGKVIALVNEALGTSVYTPAGAAGKSYDFQQLASQKVSAITAGKPAVMLLNTDSEYTYASTVINTTGFATSGRSSKGVDTVAELTAAEQGPLTANTAGKLYQVAWTLTVQVNDVLAQVRNSVLGNGATPMLQGLALAANNALTGFIRQNQKANFNLVTVDWYETGSPQTVVGLCVALNTGGAIQAAA